MSPLRHAGARVGPRGSITWPCMPGRIHTSPAQKINPFAILIFFNAFKFENKFK